MNKIISTFLLFDILLFALSGCSKDEGTREGCLNMKLEEMGMVPYSGQEIGCSSFLELFIYKDQEIFLLVNHCLDMHVFPVDCEGNNVFESELYPGFYENGEYMGIVGIEEF